jgi:hypothetical protein
METLAQQPKLAVAAVTMTPMQPQQQQQMPNTITTKIPAAAPGTQQPKKIIKAPIQILMNLKKKRQEAAAKRVPQETTDDEASPTDGPAKTTA